MKHGWTLAAGFLLAFAVQAQVPKIDDLLKSPAVGAPRGQAAAVDDRTGAAGLKEALAVGTENAVKSLARTDGYFANDAVKILFPKSIQRVADGARAMGYQKQVDEFVLSMNRAAEAAAPQAAKFFGDAIRAMTIEDVRGLLGGGDTAATDFFRAKTEDKLYAAFKPVVSRKVGEVGATKAYADMMGGFSKLPLGGKQSLDLEDYVTRKALEGLFITVAAEEKRIRTNPAARTTELLKAVFGR